MPSLFRALAAGETPHAGRSAHPTRLVARPTGARPPPLPSPYRRRRYRVAEGPAAPPTRRTRGRRNDVAGNATSIAVERAVGWPTLRGMTDAAPTTGPLRVLLVDPDERVRESLAGLLCIGHRCVVIGAAGT